MKVRCILFGHKWERIITKRYNQPVTTHYCTGTTATISVKTCESYLKCKRCGEVIDET